MDCLLILVGNHSATKEPDDENTTIQIGVGSYYKMTHQILPKTGERKVNEYTLQYDFKITETGAGRSFFQTSVNNSGDADLFINPSGEIGVAAVEYSGIAITRYPTKFPAATLYRKHIHLKYFLILIIKGY